MSEPRDMKTINEYVSEKEIKLSELKDLFNKTKEFDVVRGNLSSCGNCGDGINIRLLPSESWRSTLYCWKCQSITVMFHADRMGGNHLDHYEVYTSK